MSDLQMKTSEENKFRKLCFSLLEGKLRLWEIDEVDLHHAIRKLSASFYYREGNHFSDFDLSVPVNACAYLYRFGPLHTALVRHRLIEAISGCEVLWRRIQRRELTVLDMGSGPGTDVIGFCSAFYEFRAPKCRCFEFTLVDSVEVWKDFSRDLWQIVRNGGFGNASTLVAEMDNINVDFMKEAISKDPSLNFQLALESADIILVPRLLSIIGDPQPILEMINEYMKNDALLIVIDSPNIRINSEWHTLRHYMNSANFKCLYKSNDEGFSLEDQPYSEDTKTFGKYLGDISKNTTAEVFVLEKWRGLVCVTS